MALRARECSAAVLPEMLTTTSLTISVSRKLALWLISGEAAATFHIPVTIKTANAIHATWLKRRAAAPRHLSAETA
jgi:hypothetical protein